MSRLKQIVFTNKDFRIAANKKIHDYSLVKMRE